MNNDVFKSGFYEFKDKPYKTLKIFKHQKSDIIDVYSDDGIAHSKIFQDISNKKYFIVIDQKIIYEDDITPLIIEGFDEHTLYSFDSKKPVGAIKCDAICIGAEPIGIFSFVVYDSIQQYIFGEQLFYNATVTIKVQNVDLVKIPFTNFYFIPKFYINKG